MKESLEQLVASERGLEVAITPERTIKILERHPGGTDHTITKVGLGAPKLHPSFMRVEVSSTFYQAGTSGLDDEALRRILVFLDPVGLNDVVIDVVPSILGIPSKDQAVLSARRGLEFLLRGIVLGALEADIPEITDQEFVYGYNAEAEATEKEIIMRTSIYMLGVFNGNIPKDYRQ